MKQERLCTKDEDLMFGHTELKITVDVFLSEDYLRDL